MNLLKTSLVIFFAMCMFSVFAANIRKEFKNYLKTDSAKITEYKDIQTWVETYKKANPTEKMSNAIVVILYYQNMSEIKTNMFNDALTDLNAKYADGKIPVAKYNLYKFNLMQCANKGVLADKQFEELTTCILNFAVVKAPNMQGISEISYLLKRDSAVSKELKVKYYTRIFEKYYINLAETPDTEFYKKWKFCLSQLGLKLKSLGVDVK